MNSRSKALVTGGAGFIGSNLVYKLLTEGYSVDVVDDFSSGHMSFLEHLNLTEYAAGCPSDKYFWWRVEKSASLSWASPGTVQDTDNNLFSCSFDHEGVLSRIKEQKYDVVFHEAAIPRVSYSVENPGKTTEVNVGATVKLLEACRGNVSRIVFASSSSVYGGDARLPTREWEKHSPKSPYALQKSVDEQFIKLFCDLYDMDIVCLRYFNVYGPNQLAGTAYSTAVSAWCHAIANNLPLRSDGDGSQTRDMCYVDNVVDANVLAAKNKARFRGEAFNVACGESVSNKEILSFLRTRYPNIIVQDAPWRIGDVRHSLANIKAAQSVLGYDPKVNFWEGLERTLHWWNI